MLYHNSTSRIKLLPEELINKIAAGEVVERPASVVKEILENSLDAHATSIHIRLANYGKDSISITDNGEGMDPADARSSILRHATSKISKFIDLYHLSTLGFRGEALSSIASVSKLIIITRTRNSSQACKIECHGGIVVKETIAAHNPGTTVEVNDLFYNTPARRKFLKTDAVELSHIIDLITSYALLNPSISFRLTHNSRSLILAPAADSLRHRISSLYSSELASALIEVHYPASSPNTTLPSAHLLTDSQSSPLHRLTGFISAPHDCRSDKKIQTFFINGRLIKNNDLTQAIYQGYHSRLFISRHPVFILNLSLDPLRIDVNIHPQKTQIKIEYQELLADHLTSIIRTSLDSATTIPTTTITDRTASPSPLTSSFPNGSSSVISAPPLPSSSSPPKYPLNFYTQRTHNPTSSPASSSYAPYSSPTHSTQTNSSLTRPAPAHSPSIHSAQTNSTSFAVAEPPLGHLPHSINPNSHPTISPNPSYSPLSIASSFSTPPPSSTPSPIPPLKLFGQIHRTFWIAETEGGVLFLDQHAVHERILYDQFMQQKLSRNISIQNLLSPSPLSTTHSQNLLLLHYLPHLQELGFDIAQTGPSSFALRTIPFIFEHAQPPELIYEILTIIEKSPSLNSRSSAGTTSGLASPHNPLQQQEEEIITRLACRAAIKAGDEITRSGFENILTRLRACPFPFTCPHGRPTIIKITSHDLEKKFRRK